ncbi:MAG TPA: hypothetical protein VNA26_02975 [Chitinophagaceae bacterium]|nr:hypothetical protein [Chitinophagaceae bacterium]
MKKVITVGVFSFFLFSCDNTSTTATEQTLDSVGVKIRNKADTLGDKIENTAEKIWDSTKAGAKELKEEAKELKNKIGDKLERNRDSIRKRDSIN